jgi:hypothetical protein
VTIIHVIDFEENGTQSDARKDVRIVSLSWFVDPTIQFNVLEGTSRCKQDGALKSKRIKMK